MPDSHRDTFLERWAWAASRDNFEENLAGEIVLRWQRNAARAIPGILPVGTDNPLHEYNWSDALEEFLLHQGEESLSANRILRAFRRAHQKFEARIDSGAVWMADTLALRRMRSVNKTQLQCILDLLLNAISAPVGKVPEANTDAYEYFSAVYDVITRIIADESYDNERLAHRHKLGLSYLPENLFSQLKELECARYLMHFDDITAEESIGPAQKHPAEQSDLIDTYDSYRVSYDRIITKLFDSIKSIASRTLLPRTNHEIEFDDFLQHIAFSQEKTGPIWSSNHQTVCRMLDFSWLRLAQLIRHEILPAAGDTVRYIRIVSSGNPAINSSVFSTSNFSILKVPGSEYYRSHIPIRLPSDDVMRDILDLLKLPAEKKSSLMEQIYPAAAFATT